VETEMASSVPEKIAARIIERTPIGRLAKPAEIASLAAYLASDEASYITGQVIGVNGGLYM
ncbi:MAG: SDR family oxidoreductase, partial [Burkholderiales bacterium]